MSDGGRQVGRRQTDTPEYTRQLESCVAKSEKDNTLLQCENKRLKELIKVKDQELAKLRALQADVLTEAIKAGFDGRPRQDNQNEGNENE